MSDQDNGSQGQLFSDAAVGAFPYDDVDSDTVGYRGPTACAAAGITYRQLDYWARTGLVAPSVRCGGRVGHPAAVLLQDILVLKVVKRLLDTGVSLQNIRMAVDALRTRGVDELWPTSPCCPTATTVYECTSSEEVVDLLRGGQGVFGIAVAGALRELSGALAELPAERLDGARGTPTTSSPSAGAGAPPPPETARHPPTARPGSRGPLRGGRPSSAGSPHAARGGSRRTARARRPSSAAGAAPKGRSPASAARLDDAQSPLVSPPREWPT